jgi:hypothetical protein
MGKDILKYDEMVETALRGVVREALSRTAQHGLPGNHHFYVTFKTRAVGVEVPDYLREKYPDDMTVVIEHQFWDLTVGEESFSVTLSFKNRPERLTIPLRAITAFADPSVKWGLQFQDQESAKLGEAAGKLGVPAAKPPALAAADTPPAGKPRAGEEKKAGEVVALDAFRKK